MIWIIANSRIAILFSVLNHAVQTSTDSSGRISSLVLMALECNQLSITRLSSPILSSMSKDLHTISRAFLAISARCQGWSQGKGSLRWLLPRMQAG